MFHVNSTLLLINNMSKWESILTKLLVHFYLDYAEDTAQDYLDKDSVKTIESKTIYGGYCKVTGMPLKYGQSVSMEDALTNFNNSLTQDEKDSIVITQNVEEYADVEEHDEEKDCIEITIAKITQTK